jgi:uncharacterized membrane protein YobD (UPF0266 family)
MHHEQHTLFLYLLASLGLLCFFVAMVCSVYLLWDRMYERYEETCREYARLKRLQLRHRPRKRRYKNLHPPYRRR